jgi:hypothetical protein
MNHIIYNVSTKIALQFENEFNAWQVTEHCPYLMTLPGYNCVIRYKDMLNPQEYFNCWHIDSIEAFDQPERIKKANTPWGLWLSPYRDRRIEFYVRHGAAKNVQCAELSQNVSYLIAYYFNDSDVKNFDMREFLQKSFISTVKNNSFVTGVYKYNSLGKQELFEHMIYVFVDSDNDEDFLTDAAPQIKIALPSCNNKIKVKYYKCTSKHDRTGLVWSSSDK